jgi:hypothetical protein
MAAIRRPTLVVIAGVVALPLSMIAFAIADHQSTPQILRYLMAPGYVLTISPWFDAALRDAGWKTGLGVSLLTALIVNFVYYSLLLCWAFMLIARKFDNSSASFRYRNTVISNRRTRKA